MKRYAEFCNMAWMLQVNTGRGGKKRGQTSGENGSMAVSTVAFSFSPLGMSKARHGVACLEGGEG